MNLNQNEKNLIETSLKHEFEQLEEGKGKDLTDAIYVAMGIRENKIIYLLEKFDADIFDEDNPEIASIGEDN